MSEASGSSIVTELHYSNPDAALDWLSKVFGFEVRMIVRGSSGEIIFSELEIDGATVAIVPEQLDTMRSPRKVSGISTQTTQVRFTRDIDKHCAQALAGGASILSKPTTHFFGDRTYLAADIEGHTWNFGQRIAGAESPPPEGWSIEFPSKG